MVKNYLNKYLNKPEKLRQIVCSFVGSRNASQFVRIANIRKQYGLNIYKYFLEKDIIYWFLNSKSANQFIKNIHIRKQNGLKLYRALKACFQPILAGLKSKDKYQILRQIEERKKPKVKKADYVRFTLKGLIRRNDNHECVAYIHFYLYSDTVFYFDTIDYLIDYEQKIDREHKYLNEYYDDYGLTVGYEYVSKAEIEPNKLVTEEKQISDVFDIMRGAVRCGENKGRVFDVEFD